MSEKKHWELIASYLSGELSPDERRELEVWRKENPMNEQLFSEGEKIWNTAGKLNEDCAPDIESAWKRFKDKIEKQTKIKPQIISFPKWAKIAASVALLIGLGYFIKIILTDSLPSSNDKIAEEIKKIEIFSADSVMNFFLPDSSIVWLNVQSWFSYFEDFNDTSRNVYLIGEAFFDVQASGKQFLVMAGDNIVRVTGTSFNVRAYEESEQVEVSVFTGEVEFRQKDNPKETVRIKENETLTYNKATGKSQKQKSKKQNKWWEATSGNIKKFIKQVEKDIKKGFKKQKK